MKLPVVIFLVTTFGVLRGSDAVCDRDVTDDYRRALDDSATELYKQVLLEYNDNFVFSAKSIWMTMAAIAEGAEGEARQKLFKALLLPEEKCLREKYYTLALHYDPTGYNVILDRSAAIYLDESLRVKPAWRQFVNSQRLLDIKTTPIRRDKQSVADKFMLSEYDLNGNSILLDTLYYQERWTYADASVYRSPFYNDFGEEMGKVKFLKIKKRVKLVHLPNLNANVLSMPVGKDDRYVMLYAISLGKNRIRTTVELFKNKNIFKTLEGLKESTMEVAIPSFAMSSEIDMRKILVKMGINVWTDPQATSQISEPAALPSAYVHRVTLRQDSSAKDPPENEPTWLNDDLSNLPAGREATIGRDFIANKPFIFGLFDTETYTSLLVGQYSGPTEEDIILMD